MWKNGQDIFPGRKKGLFILHPFRPKSPPPPPQIPKSTKKVLKTCIFGQISNSSLIFYPLPILGIRFKFYYAPYLSIIEVTFAKISFSKLMPIQSYRGKNLWGRGYPTLDMRRVKVLNYEVRAGILCQGLHNKG